MTRGRTFLNTSLHAVNKHSSFTGPSPLHVYNMNVSRFSWNYFQTASSFYEPKNHQAKTITSHHTWEENSTVFLFSSREILRCSNNFSKRPSTRSLNSSWLMKKPRHLQQGLLPLGAHFSSSSGSLDASGNKDGLQNVAPTDYANETTDMTTNSIRNEWSDILDDAHQSLVSAVSYIGKRVEEVSNEVTLCVQQLYDSHPYMEKVIIPVGGTISATLLAWFVMPRILRKFHKYATRNPLAVFSGGSIEEHIPYEKSLWGALEDPARYLITFLAFYELGMMVAPTTSQIFPQAWRGAVVLSLVWFLHRWKTNVFTHIMEKPASAALDREKLLTLEKISTMGLLVLGTIALAEACGVAVQSILTVGGIGGVATAFAARDILGNILSGLSLQFSKPFSLGDNIKAGSIEGQVVEMGLTTTYLMNPEKFPVIVPNSLFSSQVIVNKSRAQLRSCIKKIPVCIDDLGKVPHVTEEIKSMLHSDTRVSLEKDAPYCFLSRIENSFLELTLGCNLKNMKKDEIYAAEQNILLQAAAIIKRHGAKIGRIIDDVSSI